MKHLASPKFWRGYRSLPKPIRALADKNFKLLKSNPHHPSLHFKKVGEYYSIRVGLNYRSLAVEAMEGLVWFWIGNHADYDKMMN